MSVNFKSNVFDDISRQQITLPAKLQTTETVDKPVNEDKNSDKNKNPFAILGGILGGGLAGATIGGLVKNSAKVKIKEAEILKNIEENCTKEFCKEVSDALKKYKNGEQLTEKAANLLDKLGYNVPNIVKRDEFIDKLIKSYDLGSFRGEYDAFITRSQFFLSSLSEPVIAYVSGDKDALKTIKLFSEEYKKTGKDIDIEKIIHDTIKDNNQWDDFQKTGVVKYENTLFNCVKEKLPDISYKYKAERILKEQIEEKSKAALEKAIDATKKVNIFDGVKKGGLIGTGVATIIASGIVIHNHMQKKKSEKSQN